MRTIEVGIHLRTLALSLPHVIPRPHFVTTLVIKGYVLSYRLETVLTEGAFVFGTVGGAKRSHSRLLYEHK